MRHKVAQPNEAQIIAVASFKCVLSYIDPCYGQATIVLRIECKLH